MKQLTIFCCLILVFNHAAHANTIDSNSVALTKQDSLSLQIDYLVFQTEVKKTSAQTQAVVTLNQFYAQANIFQKVGKAIKQAINWVARGSGHYKEEGMKKEGPYFLFDRNNTTFKL